MKISIARCMAAAFAAAAAAAAPTGALAADIDPSYLEGGVVTPAEFGSGWYLRGDVSWNFHARQESGYTTNPAIPSVSEFEYNDQLNLRIGAGYQINPLFRLEGSLEHLFNSEFNHTTAADFDGTLLDDGSVAGPLAGTDSVVSGYSADLLMANGYFDLPISGRMTPYVGAGLGVARVNYNERRVWECSVAGCDPNTYTVVDADETNWQFAWQASVGAAFRMTDNLSLDVGYTYTRIGDGPSLSYSDGTAIDRDGVSMHSVKAGLRYELW